MNTLTNSIQNSVLAQAPQGVLKAIKQASQRTGVDFAYLVRQAHAESGFKTEIKAKTSSATGLFQFIESTWLSMVEKYGHKYGIETDGKTRREILDLRRDPETASFMAAEFASENKKFLDAHWGGKVGATELYLAHFLGPGQASAFLKTRDANPMANAAVLFPDAARANKNVFYDRATGRAKSVEEIYGFFDNKFSGEKIAPPPEERLVASSVVYRKPAANQIAAYEALAAIYGNSPHSPAKRILDKQNLAVNAVEVMLMAQLDNPLEVRDPAKKFSNSLYNQ